jgi:hypothetical protein
MLDFERIFTTLATSLTEHLSDESSLNLHNSRPGGVAAISHVVTVQNAAPRGKVRLTAAAQANVFEGDLQKSERATWAADEVLSEKYGVREKGSALIEGQMLVSAASGLLITTRLGKLDLGDGWYSGDSIDTLVGPNGLSGDLPGVYAMANKAAILASDEFGFKYNQNSNSTIVTLDGVYSSIKFGSVVALELGAVSAGSFVASSRTTWGDLPLPPPPPSLIPIEAPPAQKILVTSFELPNTGDTKQYPANEITVHFDPRQVGVIEKIPTKTVTLDYIRTNLCAIKPVGNPALPVTSVDIIIQDAENTALLAKGNVHTDINGTTHVKITDIPEQGFEGELVKPITFHWGLTKITRGETIEREVLGSGDATEIWQSFKLGKAPLTYVADPDAIDGRRPELEIYVNSRKWRHVKSFYKAEPGDEIYVIKHDAANGTQIIFGDGELGARLPTGPNNVIARYRHGVGGNVDARAINRLPRATVGVISVLNPVATSGGEDPPTMAQAREQLTQSTRVLGKVVALPDFEVEAARWGGVLAAKAAWDWDPAGDEALVKLRIIAPGPGDPSPTLQDYLQGLSEPGTNVRVQKAIPAAFNLGFQLELDPGFMLEEVAAAVRERLFDDVSGYFAPRNADIGGILRRSELYAAIHEVPGVANVWVILGVQGVVIGEFPRGYALAKDTYFSPTFVSLGPNTLL